MKKLLIVAICIGLVGCTTKESEPQESATPTPTPEETSTAYFESKINIDLYKADEYYPIVDGVVTYPDGTTEEFSNGETVPKLDGTGEYAYSLYEEEQDLSRLDNLMSKEEAQEMNLPYYQENIEGLFSVRVRVDTPSDYKFSQSQFSIDEIIDGVFGVEKITSQGEFPYVIYRYSNHIPQGEDINDSFRVKIGNNTYYFWRIKDYDSLRVFDDPEESQGRISTLWWGGLDGESKKPHIFTFTKAE